MVLRLWASSCSPPKLDLPAMMKHKDVTVAANVNGVAYLFKKNKIDWVSGEGRIAAPGRVTVKGADGKETRPSKPKRSSSRPVRMSLDCRACRSTRRRLCPRLAR